MRETGESLRLELLGPMRAWRHGEDVPLGPPKQRAVLGLLASRVNDVVGFEEIIDAVWGSAVPQTAANGVHTYVAGLRRVLEPGRSRRESGEVLVSTGGGYALFMEPDAIDAERFLRQQTRARQLAGDGNAAGALEAFDAALGLWRGEAYANVPGPFAMVERARLQEIRLTAVEEWAALMLAVGRHTEAVATISDAVTREPLREKLRWLLMLALYRCGRQAHALGVYRKTRQLLNEELGIEPGIELRNLHKKILAGHPELGVPTTTTRPAEDPPPPAAVRERPRAVLRPAQLPSNARGFVGRALELAQLRNFINVEQARQDRAVTVAVIEGTAGVGKSTLALQLAHELSPAFPDGQLFVDLAGFSPGRAPVTASQALAFLLTSLGVDESRIPVDLASRAALYRSLVHGRRMLMVLDDALDAEQLRPLMPSGPACVLVTSRCRQRGLVARDGAFRVGLQPLAARESVDLLTYLIGAERLAGQDEEVTRLAALCGHLPLALRIAAESLVVDPDGTVGDLVRRYGARRGRLDYLAVAGDAAANVRDAFAASYRALPADAARMFRLLGLYQGLVITVPVAAVLAGVGRATAATQLDLLANRYLLERLGRYRYRFPALVDIFAAECAGTEPNLSRSAALGRLMRIRAARPGIGVELPLSPHTSRV